jgi:hypothetical protein
MRRGSHTPVPKQMLFCPRPVNPEYPIRPFAARHLKHANEAGRHIRVATEVTILHRNIESLQNPRQPIGARSRSNNKSGHRAQFLAAFAVHSCAIREHSPFRPTLSVVEYVVRCCSTKQSPAVPLRSAGLFSQGVQRSCKTKFKSFATLLPTVFHAHVSPSTRKYSTHWSHRHSDCSKPLAK